jgi:histidine decarboxylase
MFEREVLYYYCDLWNIPRNQAWGYLGNGSTEALMYSGYLAKQYFKSENAKKKPVTLFTDQVHYSIPNNSDLLGINTFA